MSEGTVKTNEGLESIDSEEFFKDIDDGFHDLNFDELDEEDREHYKEIEKELKVTGDHEEIKRELKLIDDMDINPNDMDQSNIDSKNIDDRINKVHADYEEPIKKNSEKSNKINENEKLKKKISKLETVAELQAIRIKNLEEVFFGTAFKKITADAMKERMIQSLQSDDIQKSITHQERHGKKIDFDSLMQENEVNVIMDETKKESKKKKYFIVALIIGLFFASLSFYADFVATTKYKPTANKTTNSDLVENKTFAEINNTMPAEKKTGQIEVKKEKPTIIKSAAQIEEERVAKLKEELLKAEKETMEKLEQLKKIREKEDVLPLTHRAKNLDEQGVEAEEISTTISEE